MGCNFSIAIALRDNSSSVRQRRRPGTNAISLRGEVDEFNPRPARHRVRAIAPPLIADASQGCRAACGLWTVRTRRRIAVVLNAC